MAFQQHFAHLLPILNNLDPDPLNDPADLFDLDQVQQPLAPALPPPDQLPAPPLTELSFITGRRGGRQATYNGFVYTIDKTVPTTLELPPGNALPAKSILQLVRVASTP